MDLDYALFERDPSLLRGKVVKVITTQEGSKFLQKSIKDLNVIAADLAEADLDALMCDDYSNYFLQKYLQVCSLEQRLSLWSRLKDFCKVTQNNRGTHVLQKLIGMITTQAEEEVLASKLAKNTVLLALNQNSVHVLCKAIKVLPPQQAMVDEVSLVFRTVTCHQSGVQAVKQLILKHDLDALILKSASELSQDPFGNYAVSFYISNSPKPAIRALADKLRPRVV